MNSTLNLHIHRLAVIHLDRSPEDDSAYRVTKKEGFDIPNLLGILPSESCFSGEEYLMLGFDWDEFEECWKYSLLTTNPYALGRAEINPFFQGESPTRIARFILSQNNRACISYADDGIILEFFDDLKVLRLHVYKDMAECTSGLLNAYELGFLEDMVA